MTRAASDSDREVSFAKTRAAKRLLRLSDELYRAIIARVMRAKGLSARLDAAARGRLLDELRRRGFKPGKRNAGKARSATPLRRAFAALSPLDAGAGRAGFDRPHTAAQARRIRLLWRKLAEVKKLPDAAERGLRSFVRRQTGRDALEWLSAPEAQAVIEGLKAWRRQR
jgi:phage gp16-like protein